MFCLKTFRCWAPRALNSKNKTTTREQRAREMRCDIGLLSMVRRDAATISIRPNVLQLLWGLDNFGVFLLRILLYIYIYDLPQLARHIMNEFNRVSRSPQQLQNSRKFSFYKFLPNVVEKQKSPLVPELVRSQYIQSNGLNVFFLLLRLLHVRVARRPTLIGIITILNIYFELFDDTTAFQ